MNIFFLDRNPTKAAEYHVDKHVVKMIQETAQLLSTAHRLLDGVWKKQVLTPAMYRNLCTLGWSGPVDYKALLLPGEHIEFSAERNWEIAGKRTMMATHAWHPSAAWVRLSSSNYLWLYQLFQALCVEKEHRYPGDANQTLKQYGDFLAIPPKNILAGDFIDPPLAMHVVFKTDDPVDSYRNYYVGDKYRFAKWTNRNVPRWFWKKIPDVWGPMVDRERLIKFLSTPETAKKTQIQLSKVQKLLP